MRLIYKLRSEQLDQIDTPSVNQALNKAHTYTIQAELVSQLARPRVPELGAGSSIDPMEALKTYLESREDLKSLASEMLEAAQSLLEGDKHVWLDTPEIDREKVGGQLRLL